jgi:hypothetical protein
VDPHRSARIVAGDLPNVEVHSASKVVHNANGSLLIDAAMPIREMTDLNCFREPPVGDSQFVYNAASDTFKPNGNDAKCGCACQLPCCRLARDLFFYPTLMRVD